MERRERRQARRAAPDPVRPVGAVGDHVEPELTVRALDREVRLADRGANAEALHDQHEVVHQALDRAVGGLLRGQDDPLVLDVDPVVSRPLLALQIRRERDRHQEESLGLSLLAPVDVRRRIDRTPLEVHVDRTARDRGERLLGDPHRLLHLGHANEVTRVVVAVLLGRDLELQTVVHVVGLGAADVVRHADRAEQRPGDRVADRLLAREHADADHAVHEDAIAGQQAMHLVEDLARLLERVQGLLGEPVGQVGLDAAHAAVGDRQPGAGHVLDQLPQELAGLDHIEEDGEGAELHGRGADAREVIADPRDLGHDHADVLAPLGDVDAEELLDRGGVPEIVDQRRHVVEPVGERDRVVPAALLAVLLEGSVQVADLDVRLHDRLAVELGDDPDDPVHGRMGRPDAEVQVLGAAAGAASLAQHELAPRRRRHRRQLAGPIRGWRRLIG